MEKMEESRETLSMMEHKQLMCYSFLEHFINLVVCFVNNLTFHVESESKNRKFSIPHRVAFTFFTKLFSGFPRSDEIVKVNSFLLPLFSPFVFHGDGKKRK